MDFPEEMLELIRHEQERQAGRYIPEDDEFLAKIWHQAEVFEHRIEGRCAGVVFFYCNHPSREFSYITLLIVNRERRKAGVGAGLVRSVLEITKQRGFRACRLEVRKDNVAALALYQSLGFAIIEERPEKYLMQLLLDGTCR